MRNIWFLSPLVLAKWGNLALGKECSFFNFWMIKFTIYVKLNITVNLIIQKLISKQIFLKKYTNWAKLSSLILTEREETKTRCFALYFLIWLEKKIIKVIWYFFKSGVDIGIELHKYSYCVLSAPPPPTPLKVINHNHLSNCFTRAKKRLPREISMPTYLHSSLFTK